MGTIINNKSELIGFARSKCIKENISSDIYYGTYLGEPDDVSPGFFKGYLLPGDADKSYFAYELTSKDGGFRYGICIYDHNTEVISFTGWFGLGRISIED